MSAALADLPPFVAALRRREARMLQVVASVSQSGAGPGYNAGPASRVDPIAQGIR